MSPRPSLAALTAELARRDPDLAALVARAEPMGWRPRAADPYAALVRSIVYQQLAGRAAAAIHGRFVAAVGDAGPTPEAVLATPEETLRAAGLSAAKVASILDLSARVVDGRVDLAHVSRLGDEDIVAQLSAVRGIGEWTAQMFLMFQLRRLDVWPTADLGVRRGYALVHGLAESPTPKALGPLGDLYLPYRSVAAMWCWEAVHLARR
ncbi:MAG: DNA-3-methyladenine glycosylase [Acidimicrobiales bacterium]